MFFTQRDINVGGTKIRQERKIIDTLDHFIELFGVAWNVSQNLTRLILEAFHQRFARRCIDIHDIFERLGDGLKVLILQGDISDLHTLVTA